MVEIRVKAVIPAGGKGSRFKPYTDIVPKPLLPIGSSEKPLVRVIIEWLKKHGVQETVLLVGYRWRYVKSLLGDGSHLGVRITYSVDDEKYHGTGGALLKAYLNGVIDGDLVLIWYGDILAPLDPQDLVKTHLESKADAVLAVADRYKVPVGVAEIDEEWNVVELKEKPWLNLYVTIGILTLNPSVLEKTVKELGTSFDIMGDLVPWMIKEGYRVKAYRYVGEWYDVGSLEKYMKLDEDSIRDMIEQ